MTAEADAPRTSNTRVRATRPWLPPLLANATLTVLLGLLVFGVLCTHVTTTPLAFLMRWYHAVILLDLSAILVAAVFCWGLSRRRLWFVGLLPIVGWVLLTLLVFASFTPVNDCQRFVLDCATVRKGRPIHAFVTFMSDRGWCQDERNAGDRSTMRFRVSEAGSEAFVVYSDASRGEVMGWRFIPD
ncbi:MAG: hypothetical protein JW889_03225 [Verrucomicrobia bacterium]|nr:hypothetical protein [Verrucomicrobiota bacterium]